MPEPGLADVTDAELAVLRTLWEAPDATIRELTDVLYPQGGAAGYSTVQKLLDRLEAKDCVRRNRKVVPHRFTAAVDRDALIGRRLQAVAESLCDGSLVPLLSNLVQQTGPLSESERKDLRELIDKLGARKTMKSSTKPVKNR
jgi:predicted transcriptional regulator